MVKPIVYARNLTRRYELGGEMINAVQGVDLQIEAGEIVAIVGASGSGKSTLLGLLGALDTPTEGVVVVDGIEISSLKEHALASIRNEKIGFVFQFFNLLDSLTALENVALPIQFAHKPMHQPYQRAGALLNQLGLGDRLHHRPNQLSGGQQQRVAIARALANAPLLILADEPTGNLNAEAGDMIMDTFKQIREKWGTTIVIVTHDPHISQQADQILTLYDGRLQNRAR